MSGALFDKPGIPGGNPALGIFGVCRAFRVLVVFHKHTGAAVKHLAVIRDFQLHTGAGYANRITAHLTIRLCCDKHRRFGLAIKLLQVDPQRAVEIENLWANRFTRSIAHAHTAEPKRVFQRAIHKQLTQLILHLIAKADVLAIQQRRPNLAGMGHVALKQPLLERACVLHADHHVGQLGFKHARRGEIISRPNLAQIHMHGVGTFGAIGAKPRPHRLTD